MLRFFYRQLPVRRLADILHLQGPQVLVLFAVGLFPLKVLIAILDRCGTLSIQSAFRRFGKSMSRYGY
jgi:hypothetical protein